MSSTSTKAGFIAIVGRPNSGKSTLLNYVLKTRLSIVTPKAQTTRERVLGILTEKNSQIVFIDTPGIHRAREGGINEYMVSEAREALDAPSAT
ncbi:MAG: GTPase, partial [Bdellovibrionota bacterium]